MKSGFNNYELDGFFDEVFAQDRSVRPHYRKLIKRFGALSSDDLEMRRQMADVSFLNQGITFTVYSDNQGTERIFPFDLIPRIIPQKEWELVERGLIQRIRALNMFLKDLYHGQKIIKEKIIPEEVVLSGKHF